MPQEKHKSLDQRNFHQDVAETDGYEVQQWHEMLLRRSSVQHHRPNQEGQYRHDGDDQQYPQNQQAKVVLPVDTLTPPFMRQQRAQRASRLEGEEEERRVIADGSDIERIVMDVLSPRAELLAVRFSPPGQVDEPVERCDRFAGGATLLGQTD